MNIRDREGNIVTSGETQNKLLEKLYGNTAGRALLKIITLPVVSRLVGAFMDSPLSIPLIEPFIRRNNIDMTQFQDVRFKSYNAFFTRRIRPETRPVDLNASSLISPCDSKLTAYKIGAKSIFNIKGSKYRVSDMLRDTFLARRYIGGYCLIFRLCVDDYHRYCFIDNGVCSGSVAIPGELHTVNPIALRHFNIYKRNSREYTVLRTENFGDVVQMEVGAMLVGRICNDKTSGEFCKGEEKGRFEFGGSTIVLLFEPDRIAVDDDILRNSANNTETVVKYGEKIGKAI